MKKLVILLIIAVFTLALSAGIAMAGGDQVHGEKSEGPSLQYCISPGECPFN